MLTKNLWKMRILDLLGKCVKTNGIVSMVTSRESMIVTKVMEIILLTKIYLQSSERNFIYQSYSLKIMTMKLKLSKNK